MAFTLKNSRVVPRIQTPIGELKYGDTVEFQPPSPATSTQGGVVTGILISATDRNAWSIQLDDGKYELDSYGNGGTLIEKRLPFGQEIAAPDPVPREVSEEIERQVNERTYSRLRLFESFLENNDFSEEETEALEALPKEVKKMIGKEVEYSKIAQKGWVETKRKLLQAQRELKVDFKDKDPGKRSRYDQFSDAQARAALEAAQGDVVKAFAILRG